MSLLLTKANEAPFSFYYRDMNKVKPEPDYPVYPRFIANPIPPDFKVVSYSDLVAEKEA